MQSKLHAIFRNRTEGTDAFQSGWTYVQGSTDDVLLFRKDNRQSHLRKNNPPTCPVQDIPDQSITTQQQYRRLKDPRQPTLQQSYAT